MQDQSLARFLDQTLLKADATPRQIQELCAQAKQHQFFGVCVNSIFIELAAKELEGSQVRPVAVVGFPLGAMLGKAKAFEAEECVNRGAKEIDMVLSIGHLKERNFDYVREDIRTVVTAARGHLVKVILETSMLTEDEKRTACTLSMEAGAHFVKTSTGFGGGGATVADIMLMKQTVGPQVGIKASGGIKSAEQAWDLINAGATRLGTSAGVELVLGKKVKGNY